MPTSDDELVVRPARVKTALLCLFLFACLVVVAFQVMNERWLPVIEDRVGFVRILEIGFLVIVMSLTIIALIGMFSPFPLFSTSHAGIRTYSLFGWFGSELTPWSEVTRINIELKGGPRTLTIYSQFKPARNRLTRWLIRKAKAPGRVRVSVMRGMTNKPFDEMVDQLLERYEHEIDGFGIQVIVHGDE